jgi:hypothetical protein
MAKYEPWSARRAARLGYLVGRGLSAEAICDDPVVAASRLSLKHVVSRWGIPLDVGAGVVTLPDDVRRGLDGAARRRRTTVEALALAVLQAVTRDRLVDAVIDDGERQ